jgi:zinc transport system substrate-binding protein
MRIVLMQLPRPAVPRRAARLLAAGVVLLAGPLSGCAALSGADTAGTQVATAFYPLQFVVERVAGHHADVTNLTSPGQEPHDLELTVRETAQIAQADLVVHERGFQAAVDDGIDQNATGEVLDAADVGLEKDPEGRPDPHFWLDPARMAELADLVATELGKVDPAHARAFDANAAGLRRDLRALDTAYADGLAGCERHTIVVSHDAFGYLRKYGVSLESVAGLSPDSEPTPADLGRLLELIRSDGITTVFSERLASPRVTESLARDAGVTTAVLDPIEGLSDQTSDEDYLSLMRTNLSALEKANGCR